MPTYLDRYLAGEHEAVWAELTALGSAVRDEPVHSDARAVARETMRRVRANVERVVVRLDEIGYQFGIIEGVSRFTDFPTHTPPSADMGAQLDSLEVVAGLLPMSLRAFYEEVGSVALYGEHPEWRYNSVSDPLVIEWQPDYFLSRYEEYLGATQTGLFQYEDERFHLDVAPDAAHKAWSSGGAPYNFVLPEPGADAILCDEPNGLLFLDYLRFCFRWGGFPGFAGVPETWRMPAEHVALLTDGLLPF